MTSYQYLLQNKNMPKKIETATPPTQFELHKVAKLLASNTSLTILRYLYHAGFGLQNSIVKATGFGQSTISKQLKFLITAGLVSKERFRTCIIYSCNRAVFQRLGLEIEVWLSDTLT